MRQRFRLQEKVLLDSRRRQQEAGQRSGSLELRFRLRLRVMVGSGSGGYMCNKSVGMSVDVRMRVIVTGEEGE